MSDNSEPASESPLSAIEKETEEFKKEVEENIKIISKIEFKSRGKDKDSIKEATNVYKEALEDALNQINGLKDRASDLQTKISEIKKENESPILKDKDFSRRQINEAKKIRDLQEKLEKLNKKIKTEFEKQAKAGEKENAKNMTGSASSSTIKSLFSKVSKQDDKSKSQELTVKSEDNLSDEQVKGLKEMIKEERKKLQEAINSKESHSNELTKEPKKLKEMSKEDGDIIHKKNLQSNKQTKLSENTGSQELKGEVKGLKELVKEEKQKLLKTKEEALKNQDISNPETELDKTTGFEEISDLEQSGHVKPMHTNEELINHNDDSDEETEDDDYENVETEHNKQLENNEQKEKHVPENIFKKSEPKPDFIQINAKKEEKREPPKKNESIFFGLFKSKSSTSLAKDVVKKLEQEEQKQEKDNFMKTGDNLGNKYKEGTMLLVIENFEPEYEGDLRAKKDEIVEFLNYGEDDPAWLEVKNNEGYTGFIPEENVKKKEENKPIRQISQRSTDSKSSGKDLWGNIKIDNLKKKGLIETTKSKVPDNFADSILFDLADEPGYSYENFLKPKLSESNLSFKNLNWDPKEHKLRNKMVSFQKIFIIHKCTNILIPDRELTVLSRNLRICLFDGESIQSNVHTIQGHLVGKDERTWIFEDDLTESVSIMDYSEFCVRVNLSNDRADIPHNLGILFELSLYCKNNTSNEEKNICIGWAHIAFHDSINRQQIVNKSYELPIRDGPIIGNLNKQLSTTSKNLASMSDVVNKVFKGAKIKFNVKEPNNYLFDTLNALPEPFIGSTIVAPFIKFYRDQLGEEFVAPLIDIGSFESSIEPIHDIFLSTFPNALYHPDILDQVKHSFILTKENMRRDEKNDNLKLRRIFIKLYNETCYPLLYHSLVPGLNLNSNEDLETRSSLINRCTKLVRKEKLLEYLLDGREDFEPFQIDELSYQILA